MQEVGHKSHKNIKTLGLKQVIQPKFQENYSHMMKLNKANNILTKLKKIKERKESKKKA